MMCEIGNRITNLINDEDIDSILAGVSGTQSLHPLLSKLDSSQKALIFGDDIHTPVVVNVRPYDEIFYREVGDTGWKKMSNTEIDDATAEAIRKELGF